MSAGSAQIRLAGTMVYNMSVGQVLPTPWQLNILLKTIKVKKYI